MMIKFTKMHGLGNDFVVIDATTSPIKLSTDKIIHLANRHTGIGADEIILIEAPFPDEKVDFVYRIFNPDGKEVEQCGNGARSAAKFIYANKLIDKKKFLLRTGVKKPDGTFNILVATIEDDGDVTVAMGVPAFTPKYIPLNANKEIAKYKSILNSGEIVEFGAVSFGNPHAVIQVADINRARVKEIGSAFKNNVTLFPQGVNVGFMQVVNENHIKLRVYERGVGETLACGSGACAAFAIGNLWQLLTDEVTVEFSIGNLEISFLDSTKEVLMKGEAIEVFNGEFDLSE